MQPGPLQILAPHNESTTVELMPSATVAQPSRATALFREEQMGMRHNGAGLRSVSVDSYAAARRDTRHPVLPV